MPSRKRKKITYYQSESDESFEIDELEASEEAIVDPEVAQSQADLIRENSDAQRRRRRGTPSTTSIWTTAAVSKDLITGEARCALCTKSIAVYNNLSTNIISHYQKVYGEVLKRMEAANSTNAKLVILNRAISNSKSSQSSMLNFDRNGNTKTRRAVASPELDRTVYGILLPASRQLSLGILGSHELEAFFHVAGGTTPKSETQYINLRPDVCATVAKIFAENTSALKVGSFTYDGWSAKLGASIAGMTFHLLTHLGV